MTSNHSDNFMDHDQPIQESTQQSKLFEYEPFKIKYINTSHVYYSKNQEVKDVKVDNFLCYQEGNILYKITQISYEDKIVRIEDRFEVSVEEDKMDLENQFKLKGTKNSDKVRIFYQDSLNKLERNGKAQKKDKKNIVKNIVKIFLSWIEKKKNQKKLPQQEEVQAEMKKMLKAQNFNNRLIKDIIGNKIVNRMFLIFLQEDAYEEVKYSRIHDKDSHYQAIQLYKKLLENEFTDGKSSLIDLQIDKMDEN